MPAEEVPKKEQPKMLTDIDHPADVSTCLIEYASRWDVH
jgi:hypothetical protein